MPFLTDKLACQLADWRPRSPSAGDFHRIAHRGRGRSAGPTWPGFRQQTTQPAGDLRRLADSVPDATVARLRSRTGSPCTKCRTMNVMTASRSLCPPVRASFLSHKPSDAGRVEAGLSLARVAGVRSMMNHVDAVLTPCLHTPIQPGWPVRACSTRRNCGAGKPCRSRCCAKRFCKPQAACFH